MSLASYVLLGLLSGDKEMLENNYISVSMWTRPGPSAVAPETVRLDRKLGQH